ncbi:hypothetical protein LCGC14_2404020 [marine sediment metagenome]|uniref:Uncharacterized protein n=1 Tax=marine sediment metagenome TaxID=412755 RepID=A0A0F9E6R9_9ZZZZ
MAAGAGKKESTQVTVSEKEYQLITQIRNLKEKGFTDEDILQLDRSKDITKENIQKARLDGIEINKMQIKIKEREIAYKKAQLEKKESLEKHDDFVDGKKPLFMLESDIEKIQFDLLQIEEINEATQEEYDKDNKED